MNTPQTRMIAIAVLMAVVLITGYTLSRGGRPFNGLLLTGHKLIALAGGAIFIALVLSLTRGTQPAPLALTALVLTGLFFLSTVVTGGLISALQTLPALAVRVHQAGPYLTLLSGAASLYLLLAPRLQAAQ